jgi:hypothetical protein
MGLLVALTFKLHGLEATLPVLLCPPKMGNLIV